MDASVPVEDSVWRVMGNQHIHAVYLHRIVAQIMAIGVKSVNDGPIQASVVVSRHENLMSIGECAELPHKVQHLRG